MESLIHNKLGMKVEFDFDRGNGIIFSYAPYGRITWESIKCIIGYHKHFQLFNKRFGILIEFKDVDSNFYQREILSTSNEWKYRYFLEKTVKYLKMKCNAVGGESWCSISDEKRVFNYYNSYINCRTLADKHRIGWFEQDTSEHIRIAKDFLEHELVADGTEDIQIWSAMGKLRLRWNEHGEVDVIPSYGHSILYQQFIVKQNQKSNYYK